jgi:hypothetical protein
LVAPVCHHSLIKQGDKGGGALAFLVVLPWWCYWIRKQSPCLPRDNPLSVDSLILSFRAMFDPNAAAGFVASYELRFGEDHFHAEVVGNRFNIARGSADQPDAIIEAGPNTLATLAYDGRDLAEAMRSGDLNIEGDKSAVERFLTLFSLPEPAPAH